MHRGATLLNTCMGAAIWNRMLPSGFIAMYWVVCNALGEMV